MSEFYSFLREKKTRPLLVEISKNERKNTNMIARNNEYILMKLNDNCGFIYNKKNQSKKYSTNKTGMAIWNILESSQKREEIISQFANQFNISVDIASSDVNRYIESLYKINLVVNHGAAV